MYKLEFLPIVNSDLNNIINYIYQKTKVTTYGKKIVNTIMSEIDKILIFPYGNSIYNTCKKMKYEYRKIKVHNYLIFYNIDEHKKIITIVRILHEKMNLTEILD